MVDHKTETIYRRYAIADEAMLKEGGIKLQILHQGGHLSGPGRADDAEGREDVICWDPLRTAAFRPSTCICAPGSERMATHDSVRVESESTIAHRIYLPPLW